MFYPIEQTEPGAQEAFVWQRASAIIRSFCEYAEVSSELYQPQRLTVRMGSAGAIIEALPDGWMMVCDEWTPALVRKRPRYNRRRLRALCVALKIPYWSAMNVDEMKAVIVRWAIFEQVPEHH